MPTTAIAATQTPTYLFRDIGIQRFCHTGSRKCLCRSARISAGRASARPLCGRRQHDSEMLSRAASGSATCRVLSAIGPRRESYARRASQLGAVFFGPPSGIRLPAMRRDVISVRALSRLVRSPMGRLARTNGACPPFTHSSASAQRRLVREVVMTGDAAELQAEIEGRPGSRGDEADVRGVPRAPAPCRRRRRRC